MDPSDDAGLDGDTRPAEQEFLFEECLSIPGICHLIHNCTKHLTSALPNFKSFFFNAFKDAVDLLKRKEFRRLYVYTCAHPAFNNVSGGIQRFA